MNNFDLRTFLAEGKLHEETEALDRESVIDFAQMVADEFTEEDANVGGTHMIYKVGKVDGLRFELDTQATENTPADDAKYGTGEGWGGSFRIEVLPNGYEIRNSEKGGLVATMDMEDGFRMLSADESRAELEGEPDVDWKNDELDMKRMEEGETLNEGLFDTVKDKLLAAKDKIMSKVSPEAIAMFKDKVEQALGKPTSELGVEDLTLANAKKVGALVKDEILAEETLNEGVKETIGNILGVLGLATAVSAGIGGAVYLSVAGLIMLFISWMTSLEESVNEAEEVKEYSSKMKKSELKEMIRAAFLNEAEGDEEEDVEAEIEADVDVDVDADMDMDMDAGEDGINVKQDADAELGGTVGDVQDNLEAALEAARKLGDEKLEDQIGNTLTFFTRTHVVKEEVFEGEVELEEGPADDLELKSLAKKMIPIFKKYGMPVEYVTDKGEFELDKKPKDAEKALNWTPPARVFIEDGILNIAVYFMSLAKSVRQVNELDIDYNNPPGSGMRPIAAKQAQKMYQELEKLIGPEFEMQFKKDMDYKGDYVMRIRKKPSEDKMAAESLNEEISRMQKIAGIKK